MIESSFTERLRKRTEDKVTWPDGPWKTETDREEWSDEATGLRCLALRGPSGAWCGYVGVPKEHPAYGKDYYKSDIPIDDVLSGTADLASAAVQKKINDISVHGGLTYAAEGDGEYRQSGVHWFGFDCAHAGDFCPKYDEIEKLGRPTGWGSFEEYRTLDYVKSEIASLAKQLADIQR